MDYYTAIKHNVDSISIYITTFCSYLHWKDNCKSFFSFMAGIRNTSNYFFNVLYFHWILFFLIKWQHTVYNFLFLVFSDIRQQTEHNWETWKLRNEWDHPSVRKQFLDSGTGKKRTPTGARYLWMRIKDWNLRRLRELECKG